MKANEIRFPTTLLEATKLFADEENAWLFVVNLRWPDGPVCPFCQGKAHSFVSTRKTWQCKTCKKQFSVKKGSIFEDSPIKFEKWLLAMWFIVNAKNGISSYELGRSLGVTQKTAWFMNHRIRVAMRTGSFEKLGDDVEADESGIGGLAKNMHKHIRARRITGTGFANKTIVAGVLERGGNIRLSIMPDTERATLHDFIHSNVLKGCNLYTDAHKGYSGLAAWYTHRIVDHAVTYVVGNVHTNGLENFWSLFKRSVRGTYASVEPYHLHRYLDEYSFRFNNRKANDGERFLSLAVRTSGKRLTYSSLIGLEDTTSAIL